MLKGGEVSDQVAQLRMQLNIAGADPQLPGSREYDAAAIEAVKKFQSKHGLQPDGQAGPKTWGMLDAIARDRVPDQDQMNDLREKATAADKLYEPATTTPPAPSTASLYRTGNLPAEIRDQFVWNWAACEHQLGNFDQALSLYQEYLETPGTSLHDHRDATQPHPRMPPPPPTPRHRIQPNRGAGEGARGQLVGRLRSHECAEDPEHARPTPSPHHVVPPFAGALWTCSSKVLVLNGAPHHPIETSQPAPARHATAAANDV